VILYWGTSALAKALLSETSSTEIRELIASTAPHYSSELLDLEMQRIGIREGRSRADIESLVGRVNLLVLDSELLDEAGLIKAPLGALDAIHVATYRRLVRDAQGEDEVRLVAFDQGILNAAADESLLLHKLSQT